MDQILIEFPKLKVIPIGDCACPLNKSLFWLYPKADHVGLVIVQFSQNSFKTCIYAFPIWFAWGVRDFIFCKVILLQPVRRINNDGRDTLLNGLEMRRHDWCFSEERRDNLRNYRCNQFGKFVNETNVTVLHWWFKNGYVYCRISSAKMKVIRHFYFRDRNYHKLEHMRTLPTDFYPLGYRFLMKCGVVEKAWLNSKGFLNSKAINMWENHGGEYGYLKYWHIL